MAFTNPSSAAGPAGRLTMDLPGHLRLHSRANRLANLRLHNALAPLSDNDFHAPRTGFFSSLAATLNHVLAVDAYYVGALHGETGLVAGYDAFVPAADVATLAARQAASDERLIAFCERLDAAGCAAVVALDRGGGRVEHDRAAAVLAHLFMHQTHHRGQAHAMLSGTTLAPPQLDEFLLASDAPLRVAEMTALGWHEEAAWGPYNLR
jgi:uncharacterized damage-inducible protein DinB